MHDRNRYLKKIAMWMLVAITVVWVGVYQIIITGAFSRSFWANIVGVHHVAKQSALEKLTLQYEQEHMQVKNN